MSEFPPKPGLASPYSTPKSGSQQGFNHLASKTSGKAIASLILGLSSFICFLLTGLLGLIFGVLALLDIGRSQGRLTGGPMAIIGIVTSVIGCFLSFFVFIAMLLPAVQQVREVARRSDTMSNMKRMAIGMHSFHEVYEHLPYSSDAPEGEGSKLSWRVQILPFIGENRLYVQFKHDEPWDSPHNLALADQMPDIFRTRNFEFDPGLTNFVVPVTRMLGSNAPSNSDHRVIFIPGRARRLEQIADGASRTIMILEVNPEAAVVWTKPEDWEFDPDHPMRDLGNARPGGFCVAMADSSTHFIDNNFSIETFRELVTSF